MIKKMAMIMLLSVPMGLMAQESYKIFSINKSTKFFTPTEQTPPKDEQSLGDTGPGPTDFVGEGDEQAGFYGEVAVSELFSGDELATAINLTSGQAQHSTEPWLKFAYKGNLLYIAKKPYRYNLSWDSIADVGAVYGDNAVVSKNDIDFKVRLIKGAGEDPTQWEWDNQVENGKVGSNMDPPSGEGSEWNNLMYRVHESTPKRQQGENWANYTSLELVVDSSSSGRDTWCQETAAFDESHRVQRGYMLTNFNTRTTDTVDEGRGWRPVLEVVR